jgi:hypothetical protein
MKRTLLLDIDYTTFYKDIPQPYLKAFILRHLDRFDIYFYTAAKILDVPFETIILLDEAPMYDHPNKDKIIHAEAFDGDLNDTYLSILDIQ